MAGNKKQEEDMKIKVRPHLVGPGILVDGGGRSKCSLVASVRNFWLVVVGELSDKV